MTVAGRHAGSVRVVDTTYFGNVLRCRVSTSPDSDRVHLQPELVHQAEPDECIDGSSATEHDPAGHPLEGIPAASGSAWLLRRVLRRISGPSQQRAAAGDHDGLGAGTITAGVADDDSDLRLNQADGTLRRQDRAGEGRSHRAGS